MRIKYLLTLLILTAAHEGGGTLSVARASTTDDANDNVDNNVGDGDDIPTFHTSNTHAQASDYANYFSAYSQLYHQKLMLEDHNRMTAYHSAILGNKDLFKDKVVMDVGAGSSILATWAAMAGAKRVYAIEYTDMAKHARNVVKANGVDHIVTVVQGAVEDFSVPEEDWVAFGLEASEELLEGEDDDECEIGSDESNTKKQQVQKDEEAKECKPKKKNQRVVDIIISEWMGYILLRESMLDSVIRARDNFLKQPSGIMFPSHATILLAPVYDEEGRKEQQKDYSNAMSSWNEFTQTTFKMYGVDMSCLDEEYEKEQREYYILNSMWSQLEGESVLGEASVVKELDMSTCTLEDARGVGLTEKSTFGFDIEGRSPDVISGFAGFFTVDFKSRTDDIGKQFAPKVENPVILSTEPEAGVTHWGQLVFYLPSPIPLLADQTTWIDGTMEMVRSSDNKRLYTLGLKFTASRRKTGKGKDSVLMQGAPVELLYQIT